MFFGFLLFGFVDVLWVFVIWICGSVLWVCRSSLWVVDLLILLFRNQTYVFDLCISVKIKADRRPPEPNPTRPVAFRGLRRV